MKKDGFESRGNVKFLILSFVLMGMLSLNVLKVTASAATISGDVTSVEYSISTGKLVITGTNFVQTTGALNDVDPTKMIIGDGKNNLYMLTSSTKKVEITDATSITVVLGSKDQAAVARIFDKGNGKTAQNGGTYKLYVVSGWNGKDSKSDTTGAEITIANDLPVLESAAYDYSKGELTLAGAGFQSITGSANDIVPKYLAITDFATFAYILSASSKSVDVTDSKSAKISLSTKDKAELECYINQNGTKTKAGSGFNLIAFDGWNGVASLANASGVVVTVSEWTSPVVSLGATQATSITIGTAVKAKISKVGTLYLVAKGTNVTDKTNLDLLSTGEKATTATEVVKMVANTANAEVSISTAKLLLSKDDQVEYVVYGSDRAEELASTGAITVTIKQKAATTITGTLKAAPGTAAGTTKIETASAQLGNGNKIAVLATSTIISGTSIPLLYSDLPSAATKDYSGGDISGVSATSVKYIGVYEYDPSNSDRVVKFKMITLSAANIAKVADTGASGNTVTNNVATLGLIGVTAQSDRAGIATAAIANGKVVITATEVEGTVVVTVTDASGNTATIEATVAPNKTIKIVKITKYVAPVVTDTEDFTKAKALLDDLSVKNFDMYGTDKYSTDQLISSLNTITPVLGTIGIKTPDNLNNTADKDLRVAYETYRSQIFYWYTKNAFRTLGEKVNATTPDTAGSLQEYNANKVVVGTFKDSTIKNQLLNVLEQYKLLITAIPYITIAKNARPNTTLNQIIAFTTYTSQITDNDVSAMQENMTSPIIYGQSLDLLRDLIDTPTDAKCLEAKLIIEQLGDNGYTKYNLLKALTEVLPSVKTAETTKSSTDIATARDLVNWLTQENVCTNWVAKLTARLNAIQ